MEQVEGCAYDDDDDDYCAELAQCEDEEEQCYEEETKAVPKR